MNEKIKVAVRLRPLIEQELLAKDKSICIDSIDTSKQQIIIKKDFEKRQFHFDTIFDSKTTQSQIYNQIAKNIVTSVIKGFNGTIFCYGQTGTGKTYTITGKIDSEEKGIIQRTFEQIFHEISLEDDYTYSVQIGYLQIYMEMLLDLIKPDNSEVKIRESLNHGVFVSGLEWHTVETPLECLKIVNQAEKNKVIAFTNLNAHSSRSHSILIIKLDKKSQRQHSKSLTVFQKTHNYTSNYSQDITIDHFNINNNSVGTLYLVDLAGSESIKKSKATGERLNEARSINSSLTALGKCIHALTFQKNSFIPFRDSKLTRILQEALGGNCKTALIINIGPAKKHVDETLSSLIFGMRAMKITNNPQLNQINDYEQLLQQLKQELEIKEEIIQNLETYKLQSNQQDNHLNNQDIQYKQQLEKVEEQHKEFLEEIDKVMVELEQENEQLKKELAKTMIELEESRNSEQFLQQEIQILKQNQHKQNAQIQKFQFNKNNLRNLGQPLGDLKSNENQKDCQLQEITFRNSALIQLSNQNQLWKSETSQFTTQYTYKLDEVKKIETFHSGKENQILQEEKLKNDDQSFQIKQLTYELSINQEKLLQQNQVINSLNQQISKLNEQRQFEHAKQQQDIQQLENQKFEISCQLQQSEKILRQLNEQLQQNELFYKQQQEININYKNQLEYENFELKKEILIVQQQYESHQKTQNQIYEQLNNEIQTLKQQKEDYYQQLQPRTNKNQNSILQSIQSNISNINQLNSLYNDQQNFDFELKKSITVSGENEGQIVIEMQMKILQLEDQIEKLQKQIQYKNYSEENDNQETIQNILDQLIDQIEKNIQMPNNKILNNNLSNKISENQTVFGQDSFQKLNIKQLVESLFIDSRQSAQSIIPECQEFVDSEIGQSNNNNLNQDLLQNQEFCNEMQESAFSFSQDLNITDFQQSKSNLIQINNKNCVIQESLQKTDELNFQVHSNNSFKQQYINNKQRDTYNGIQKYDKSQDQNLIGIQQQQKSYQEKPILSNKIEVEDLQKVIKLMSQILYDQTNQDKDKDKDNDAKILDILRSSLIDFNSLCNTLTTYFS